jgi:hypothetical protein
MPRVFIVTFQRQGRRDRGLAKFIVIADSADAAIKDAWDSTDAEFQSGYIFQSGLAVEMKNGVRRVL